MDNDFMQDNDDDVADIKDILASSDDDDIMKDFNFDDILENTEDNKIVTEKNEEEKSLISQDDYSVEKANNVWDETSSGDDVLQEDAAANIGGDEWNNISDKTAVEQNEIVEPDVSSFAANNINSKEDDNIFISEKAEQATEKETDFGGSGVLSENGLMSQADDYEDYGNKNAEQADFSPLGNLNEPSNIGFLHMYDGGLSDNMYSINKEFESADFNGNENCETIHVSVGHDTYGWNVEFANSVMMSLRDVKEYQKRQGCLPFNSGTIRYGNKVLRFRDIKRIVVYESVKYFSYGA